MLSSADAALVRRDGAIPGLAVVLDPDALAAALRRAAPDADLRTAQITYARYKPDAYCRVTCRLDVAGAELGLDVRACRPDDFAAWCENGEGASVSGLLGPGRIVLEHCAVLATVFPNDLKLTALQHLTDSVERRELLRELLPDRPDLWQGELRCLRYQPERRYVAELRAADGARAVLKSYTRKAYTRGKRNATAFESRGPLRVARLLGCSEGHRLLAFEWLPGRTLLDCFAAPEVERAAAVSTAAAALAELHAQPPDGLVCWTPEDEVLYVSSLAAEIAFICPWLARRAEQLGRRLGAEMAVTPAMHLSVHGDFSGSQVLVDQREAAIVDLDSAYCGDPAYDLGKFVAQAEDCALLGDLSPSQVELLRDALLQGYGRARGRAVLERIRWYTAAALIRRARFPFRAREPDWPQRTESLLDRAEAVATRCRRESG